MSKWDNHLFLVLPNDFSLKFLQLGIWYTFVFCMSCFWLHSCSPVESNWSWIRICKVGGPFVSDILWGPDEVCGGHPCATKIRILLVYVCGLWSERPPRQTIREAMFTPPPTAQPPAVSLCNIFEKAGPCIPHSAPPTSQTWWYVLVVYYVELILLLPDLCNSCAFAVIYGPVAIDSVVDVEPIITSAIWTLLKVGHVSQGMAVADRAIAVQRGVHLQSTKII